MVILSDSFTHSNHKLSESSRAAITGLQNMALPPPAYRPNPTTETSDFNSDDGDDWKGPPVTIHIDASIMIEGTSNQVALPPHPSPQTLRVIGANLRAAQGSPQEYLGPALTTNRLACDRAEQISDAVMQALKDSGIFAGTVSPQRRLDVHVDASVSVKGEGNVLTTHVPLRKNVPVSGTGIPPTESPSPLRTADRPGRRESGGSTLSIHLGGPGTSTGEHGASDDLGQALVPGDAETRDGSKAKVSRAAMQLDADTDPISARESITHPKGEAPVSVSGTPSTKRKRAFSLTSNGKEDEEATRRDERADF